MKPVGRIFGKLAFAAMAVSAISVPAMARDWRGDDGWHERHDRDWGDRHYRRHHRDRDYREIYLRGPGVDDLHPWFRSAKSGRDYAARRAGSYITEREAYLLNREAPYRTGYRNW